MPTNKPSRSSKNKSISINGDVRDSNVFIGDNNLFQKIINYIFPSEKETLEQRNRRILLNHVENAWIKGVLDASLHGAALLDLGIKQDPEAVTQYPWTLKKESTDETLPAGTSMLEIFDSIGMGRSLLILGAPGSGKTTMLLELARGLIARAREDVTQPIPMVFNLASWTEKLTLADWLAQELNNLYSVPRKTAPDWVKGNKLLLLLDGLDEVRQESRAKCVEAINEFRKQNGLTSLAVCSRSQDYADLSAKLSFEGAIEVQPLTQEQITEFFNRFGEEMAGIKQALEKDGGLREIAETPLFLSIMLMAYRDKRDVEILVSGNEKARRKHLFDTYIERIFEHPRSVRSVYKRQDVLRWLAWLAQNLRQTSQSVFMLERMSLSWLEKRFQKNLYSFSRFVVITAFGGILGIVLSLPIALYGPISWMSVIVALAIGLSTGILIGIGSGLIAGLIGWLAPRLYDRLIKPAEIINWSWKGLKKTLLGGIVGIVLGIGLAILPSMFFGIILGASLSEMLGDYNFIDVILMWFLVLILFTLIGGLLGMILTGLTYTNKVTRTIPNQGIRQSEDNALKGVIFSWIALSLIFMIFAVLFNGLNIYDLFMAMLGALSLEPAIGFPIALLAGGLAVIHHYVLRFVLSVYRYTPWNYISFLDHCVDLIFLRRVGGGYIFVHRLLMEHFAEMYVESPTSKGN